MGRKGIEYGSITLHPDGLPHGPQPGKVERTRDFVDDFRTVVAGSGSAGVATIFEIALTARWRESDRDASVGLADAVETMASPRPEFKLRCGGPEPSDVPSEAEHSLTVSVEVHPFDPGEIVEQDYDVWHLQPLLYAIDSFEQLADGFDDWVRSERLL